MFARGVVRPVVTRIATVTCMLLLLGLLGTSNSTLGVYNWQALESTDETLLDISYSIANYGFAPLGKTIIGKLTHSPNFDDQCLLDSSSSFDVDYQNSFMLIPRGECEFVTKTLNAQALGAQLAIIMDDKAHEGAIQMSDNGYGHKVTIPSVFINFENGEKLKQILRENEGEDGEDVMVKMAFENSRTDKVAVTFYLQSNNHHSYRFVENFRKLYPKVREEVDLHLVYSTSQCQDCPPADCYKEHAYCAFHYLQAESANGRLILDQQVREQLLFELHPKQWWNYMQFIGDQCSVISELETCQAQALQKLGIDAEEFGQQFKETFEKSEENRFLFENRLDLTHAGVSRYPTVTLNQVKVRGNLKASFVFDDICNTLVSPPKGCSKEVEGRNSSEQTSSIEWPTLVLVVAMGVLLFSLIVVVMFLSSAFTVGT